MTHFTEIIFNIKFKIQIESSIYFNYAFSIILNYKCNKCFMI